MVRDSMRLLLALALSAATFIPAGCARQAYSLPEAPGYGQPSTGERTQVLREAPVPRKGTSGQSARTDLAHRVR